MPGSLMIKAYFSKYRIQQKFSFIMSSASVTAICLVMLCLMVYERISYKESVINEFNMQGDIVKQHLDVAMSFNDEISASESLAAFSANDNVLSALVISLDKTVFASYLREGISVPENIELQRDHHFSKNKFVGLKKIVSANQQLGYLYVEYTIPSLVSRLAKYLPLLMITAMTLFLLNVIVSMAVHRFIIRPMKKLTEAAVKISKSHDYSVRTGLDAHDEIGDLAVTLDQLLDVTETHQNDLLDYNRQLQDQSNELEQQHHQVAAANKEYQDLLKSHELLLHSANEGIIGLSVDGQITFANPRAALILGLEVSKLKDYYIVNFFSGDEVKEGAVEAAHNLQVKWFGSNIYHSIVNGECCHCEGEIWQTYRATNFHVGYNFAAILDSDHECTGGVLVFEDITLRKNDEIKMSNLANFDSLTHLVNRRFFYDSMFTAVNRSKRSGEGLALLYIDIDRFKQINDTYGHEGGDQVLLEVAKSLKRCTRAGDLVSRLAGDEFAILLYDVGEPVEVQAIALKVLENLCLPHIVNGNKVIASCSIGQTLIEIDQVQFLLICICHHLTPVYIPLMWLQA